jgi:aldose 1-epimerase
MRAPTSSLETWRPVTASKYVAVPGASSRYGRRMNDANPGARSPSGAQWRIAADGHEAVVVEVGGGLRTYRVYDVDQVAGYDEIELCVGGAGQVLAPWPNRLRDGRYTFRGTTYQLPITEPPTYTALHGLVNWLRWRAETHEAAAVTVACDLPAQPGYPWTLSLRTRWQVGSDGLRVRHEVTNQSGSPAPFGLAAHPYLRLAGVPVDDTMLHVPARSRLVLDGRQLPIAAVKVDGGEYDFTAPRRIGAAVIDTTFADLDTDADGGSRVVLSGPDGSSAVTIWADHRFSWWQVFTADTLTGDRHRRSVAVEPMTCPPDAFRSGRGVIVLEAGQSWSAEWGIRPAGLAPRG